MLEKQEYLDLAWEQYKTADNMTDTIAVLQAVNDSANTLREQIFADFYTRWQHEPLVINKWLGLQAISELENTLSKVKILLTDKAFDLTNPNKVYALIGGFTANNPIRFHANDGSGYKFLSTQLVQLNKINPQVAARMFTPFTKWRRFDLLRQKLILAELEMLSQQDLSRDLLELVSRTLQG